MKAIVQEPSPCRRSIEVEVPADKVREEIERTAKRFARTAAIPGFRKGQAPATLIRRRFQKEIDAEVAENLAREYSWKVIDENKMMPLHQPMVEEAHLQEGEPFTFKATFEVRPEFTLGAYRGLAVERRRQAITPEIVARHLADLQEGRARFEAIEGRALEIGDIAVLDLQRLDAEGAPAGEPRTGVHVEMSEAGAPAELRAALPGSAVGEEREVQLAPAAAAEGGAPTPAPERYRVAVRALRRKVLPALDDELAKEIGFDSLAALEERLRQDLERRSEERAQDDVREKLLSRLVQEHPFAAPEVLVHQEQSRMLELLVGSMVRQGIDPARVGWDWDAKRAELHEPAERRVRADLILDAVAAKEGLETSDEEVLGALREEAERSRSSAAAVKARLEKEGRLELLKIKMLRAKSLDLVVRSANITDKDFVP